MPFCLRSLCRAWETTDLPLPGKPVTQTHQPLCGTMKGLLGNRFNNHFLQSQPIQHNFQDLHGIERKNASRSVQNRNQRRKLVQEKQYWQVITEEFKRSVEVVKMKAKWLGLSVVVDGGRGSTTTNDLPQELPGVEENLKVLSSVDTVRSFDPIFSDCLSMVLLFS